MLLKDSHVKGTGPNGPRQSSTATSISWCHLRSTTKPKTLPTSSPRLNCLKSVGDENQNILFLFYSWCCPWRHLRSLSKVILMEQPSGGFLRKGVNTITDTMIGTDSPIIRSAFLVLHGKKYHCQSGIRKKSVIINWVRTRKWGMNMTLGGLTRKERIHGGFYVSPFFVCRTSPAHSVDSGLADIRDKILLMTATVSLFSPKSQTMEDKMPSWIHLNCSYLVFQLALAWSTTDGKGLEHPLGLKGNSKLEDSFVWSCLKTCLLAWWELLDLFPARSVHGNMC